MGMSAAEAYRRHVAREKDADPLSIDPAASKLANCDKVSARISELREKVAAKVEAKFELTRDKWLEKLGEIARDAHTSGDYSAATGALKEVGKAADFYAPEKVEVSGSVTLLSDAVAKVFGK